MEHPALEIEGVINSLTTGTFEEQESALNTYFLRSASFVHPFCRVPSFSKGTIPFLHDVDSLRIILAIYRWYRMLSPRIKIRIESAVFDRRISTLYVSVDQTFALRFVPFYKAHVHLTTVLRLEKLTNSVCSGRIDRSHTSESHEPALLAGPGQRRVKYFIKSQEDLYQVNEFLSFLAPGLAPVLWFAWQLYATLLCVVGNLLGSLLYLVLSRGQGDMPKYKPR